MAACSSSFTCKVLAAMADDQLHSSGGHYRVVVVGGGLAGLAAARMLADFYGLKDEHAVLLLEAATSLGGRIKHITGLAPWPVEVGVAHLIFPGAVWFLPDSVVGI